MDAPRPTLPEPPPDRYAVAAPVYGPPEGPPPEEPEHDHQGRDSFLRRRLGPIGAAILAFLAKVKAILLFLGQFKLLVTAGSMAVSLVAYASIWNWTFALGFVVLLLVHEMGHVLALRREGIPASAPMFIPFLGAVVSARSLGDDALAEARVGLAGPVLGSIGAGVCLLIWKLTGHDYWRALGFTGLFLNLFNLLPVVPLDGGRAMAAMSPWMWCAGFAATVALAVAFPNPVIIVIAIVAAMETWRRLRARHSGNEAEAAYYRVSVRGRALVGLTYLALVVLLVLGMHVTHLQRTL
jgi:Zn-dependent protease